MHNDCGRPGRLAPYQADAGSRRAGRLSSGPWFADRADRAGDGEAPLTGSISCQDADRTRTVHRAGNPFLIACTGIPPTRFDYPALRQSADLTAVDPNARARHGGDVGLAAAVGLAGGSEELPCARARRGQCPRTGAYDKTLDRDQSPTQRNAGAPPRTKPELVDLGLRPMTRITSFFAECASLAADAGAVKSAAVADAPLRACAALPDARYRHLERTAGATPDDVALALREAHFADRVSGVYLPAEWLESFCTTLDLPLAEVEGGWTVSDGEASYFVSGRPARG